MLRDAVGSDGVVVGLDYSTTMTERASERSVGSVLRADAGTLPLRDGCVDAAIASLSLSAMSEIDLALSETTRVLRDGGRLAVVDGRLPDSGITTALSPIYRRMVNWQDNDVRACMENAFRRVELIETYDAGLAFVAVAE